MRPGQNKRMRGRNNNNNRKGPNPLTRSYESNGPDVKIRGTAHHVAEKYLQLARDAQSSGDPVMAESYLQHAEHYFRLIAAAQLAQQQAQTGYVRPPGEADYDEDDDDDFSALPDRFASPVERAPPPFYPPNGGGQPNGQGQQPQASPPPAPQQQPYGERQPYQGDRPFRPNNDRHNGQNNNNRFNQNRGPRDFQGRRDVRDPPREFRNDGSRDHSFDPARVEAGAPQPPRPEPAREPRPPADPEPTGLPAFITAPAPRPSAPEPVVGETASPDWSEAAPPRPEAEGEGYHLRPRRRRRRPDGETSETEAAVRDDVPLAE